MILGIIRKKLVLGYTFFGMVLASGFSGWAWGNCPPGCSEVGEFMFFNLKCVCGNSECPVGSIDGTTCTRPGGWGNSATSKLSNQSELANVGQPAAAEASAPVAVTTTPTFPERIVAPLASPEPAPSPAPAVVVAAPSVQPVAELPLQEKLSPEDIASVRPATTIPPGTGALGVYQKVTDNAATLSARDYAFMLGGYTSGAVQKNGDQYKIKYADGESVTVRGDGSAGYVAEPSNPDAHPALSDKQMSDFVPSNHSVRDQALFQGGQASLAVVKGDDGSYTLEYKDGRVFNHIDKDGNNTLADEPHDKTPPSTPPPPTAPAPEVANETDKPTEPQAAGVISEKLANATGKSNLIDGTVEYKDNDSGELVAKYNFDTHNTVFYDAHGNVEATYDKDAKLIPQNASENPTEAGVPAPSGETCNRDVASDAPAQATMDMVPPPPALTEASPPPPPPESVGSSDAGQPPDDVAGYQADNSGPPAADAPAGPSN